MNIWHATCSPSCCNTLYSWRSTPRRSRSCVRVWSSTQKRRFALLTRPRTNGCSPFALAAFTLEKFSGRTSTWSLPQAQTGAHQILSVSVDFIFKASFPPRNMLELSFVSSLPQPLPAFLDKACSSALASVRGMTVLHMSVHTTFSKYHFAL